MCPEQKRRKMSVWRLCSRSQLHNIMMSWHGNTFHISGPLWGESIWKPVDSTHLCASNVWLSYLLYCLSKQVVEQTINLLMKQDTMTSYHVVCYEVCLQFYSALFCFTSVISLWGIYAIYLSIFFRVTSLALRQISLHENCWNIILITALVWPGII